MILSDRDIRAAMCRPDNPLIIDPPVLDQAIQPASLELTLGSEFIIAKPDNQVEHVDLIADGLDHIMLPQGGFYLATSVERVAVPTDLVAQVNGKSSLGRLGLVAHQTAGFIDPGFRGQVTLELSNASPNPVKLWAGMRVCQLVFFQMTSPALRPYGSEGLGSHYQDQVGTTPSRG